ncbi:hypothetical protein [Paraburkholderia haematera]|jgi:hypothetical protein|uniref:Uncharacterized protein n=1 Tax=Paraburkholderia haematera TaxID=2793077 RepID=A0ABN7L897_9BURK|nr:hypothetical protein [Paraburkholderia haematera]CAE6730783.1 hypothetical protein R69888_02050 [Paraburkholderia haematera]
MSRHPENHEHAFERLNTACQRLFETWCESRSVIPLGYLLHCWPLPDKGHASVKRLADGLRELGRTDPGALSGRIWPILCELASCIDEIVLYPRIYLRKVVDDAPPVARAAYVM